MGEARRRRLAGTAPEASRPANLVPMWVVRRVADGRFVAIDKECADDEGTTSELRDAAHFERGEVDFACSEMADSLGGTWKPHRTNVTEEQKWTYQARYKRISFDQLDPELRDELLASEAAARAITYFYPPEEQMVNSDEFAMFLFDTGCRRVDQQELARAMSVEDFGPQHIEVLNAQILRAGAAALRQSHGKAYIFRAHEAAALLQGKEDFSVDVLAEALNATGYIPPPDCLALDLFGQELVQDARDFATSLSGQGIPTTAELTMMVAFLKGMQLDKAVGRYAQWEASAEEFDDRPAAGSVAAPVMRDGLKALRHWDATSGPSWILATLESLAHKGKAPPSDQLQ